MLRTNPYLEPGVYIDEHDYKVVVLDIISHSWNPVADLQEVLSTPLVMARDLMIMDGNRYIWPLDVFKRKFKIL